MAEIKVRWEPHLQVSDETVQWLCSHLDEMGLLHRYAALMATELAANDGKGNRPGWLTMNPKEALSEVLYHAAKLTYAVRQFEQGDGSIEEVREFAADVGNCSLMVIDIVEQRALAALRDPDEVAGHSRASVSPVDTCPGCGISRPSWERAVAAGNGQVASCGDRWHGPGDLRG